MKILRTPPVRRAVLVGCGLQLIISIVRWWKCPHEDFENTPCQASRFSWMSTAVLILSVVRWWKCPNEDFENTPC